MTNDTQMKLHVHDHTMVIYIQYIEIPSIGVKVMAEDKKLWQSKGGNSSIADYTLTKLHVHNLIMAIYISCKFHEIQFIS